MPENNINAYCSICGKGYHVCNSCLEQRNFKPWRVITDSIEHYKIYLVLHSYTISKNKEIARQELQKCNLSELDTFEDNIKVLIKKILDEDKSKKNSKPLPDDNDNIADKTKKIKVETMKG